MRALHRTGSLSRRAGADDSGFTLAELLVVMVILGGCLLGLLAVQVSALRTVTVAKERQQATALTTRTMEQQRALPYDVVTAGLNTGDLAGDANITAGRLRPAGYPNTIDELIVAGGSQATAPLFPHCQQGAGTRVRGVQYRVCSYITLVSPTAGDTSKGYWLTVITTWRSNATQARTITVSTRSQVFSPAGCLSTATRPFSGPCQAFHDGTAGSQAGGLTLTGSVEGARLLPDNPMITGRIDLHQVTASVQSQQVVSVQASALTSGAGLVDGTSPAPSTGARTATSGAATDPDASAASVPSSSTVTQSASTLNSAGTSSTFHLQPGHNDSGASVSTTRADTTAGCQDLSGTAVTSGQACGSSRLTPTSGTQAMTLDYGQGIPIGSVEPPGSSVPSRSFAARYLTPGGTYCPTASGAGCLSAGTSRALGTASVGGLPSAATGRPAGFGPAMVSVSGYTDTATAAAGLGVESPAASATRAGTLSYWNGTGYTTVSLSSGSTGDYSMGPVEASYDVDGETVLIRMTGSIAVRPGGPAAAAGPATCQPQPCVRSSSSGTVVGSVLYELFRGATVVGHFTATLNLGSSAARATYRAPLVG